MSYAVVERNDVSVLYVGRRDSLPQAPKDAFEELERKIGSLRGRKFYGVFYAADDEYRACVEPKPGDNAAALRLSDGVIPGGRYARDVLRGDPPEVYSGIPRAFDALVAAVDHDPSRPSIEFYRRNDEIVLFLPIRG